MKSVLFGMKADWSAALERSAQSVGIQSQMADLRHADLSGYDAVVPLTLWDRDFLDERRIRGDMFNALFPSSAAQENCHDKLAFNRLMAAAGLGDYIPAMFGDPAALPLGKPIIVKRRKDEWGKLSRICCIGQDAPLVYDPDQEFLQEYVPGTVELSAYLLMRDGRIVFSRTAIFDMPDMPHVKGINTGHQNLAWRDGTRHGDLFTEILDTVGFANGACCIDFREVDGKPKIFEINPRLGGSLTGDAGSYLQHYLLAACGTRARSAADSVRLPVAA
ncbi:hypothetical protein BDE18_1465 [Paracoccus pantotrophus]|uniref:ATP-grasp domain-containing protein n=2 Tax=Paracoccus pantotrophus TaxID=82367 RepID=A0ABX9SE86_PARPN|nr:hypothetical protein BDE18_1465 [Paracoccus pantotrophus]SFO84119.1 hypothetical protein SAMN04244567_03233 [Paracoccus pantotrophus]